MSNISTTIGVFALAIVCLWCLYKLIEGAIGWYLSARHERMHGENDNG